MHLVGSPLYHTAVLMFAGGSLHFGHTVVVMDKWTPEGCLEVIETLPRHDQPHGADAVPPPAGAARGRRATYDVSSLRHMIHAAAPCPVDVKRRMLDVVGPGDLRVLRRERGRRHAGRRPRSGSSIPAPSAARGRARRSASSTTTATDCPTGTAGHGVHGARQRGLRVPQGQGQDRREPPRRLLHRRRRRLPRRGRLPVPLRPQDRHDHLGRRQHLPGRDRERCCSRTRRSATSPCSAFPNEDWGEEVKAVDRAGAGRRGRRRRWPTRSSPSATSSIAKYKCPKIDRLHRRACRATRTASSTSASCATRTGRGASGRSEVPACAGGRATPGPRRLRSPIIARGDAAPVWPALRPFRSRTRTRAATRSGRGPRYCCFRSAPCSGSGGAVDDDVGARLFEGRDQRIGLRVARQEEVLRVGFDVQSRPATARRGCSRASR